ncbi:hypothetical protein ABPG74_017478 [Tetrahymena malaccensis]
MIDLKPFNFNIEAYCYKHPQKKLEFFCISNESSERLFCSNCILKGQLPCKQSDLIDIEEFLLSQKQILDTKGIFSYPEINKYLQQKKRREVEYQSIVQNELSKFSEYVNLLQERVNNAFKNLRKIVENEFTSKENQFMSQSNQLIQTINQSFTTSLLGNYKSFEELLSQFDLTSSLGLKDLVIALMEDEKNRMELQNEVKKQFTTVQSLEKQVIQVSEEQLSEIETQIKQLEEKVGNTLANIVLTFNSQVNELGEGSPMNMSYVGGKDQSQQFMLNESVLNQSVLMNQTIIQMQENALQTVKISDIRKIVCSADFVSGHTRQINSICTYGPNKVATGGEDNTIRLWNLETMECLLCLRGHTQGVRDLISLPNGFLVSASYDKLIKIWNTSQSLINMNQSISSPTNTPNVSIQQDYSSQCLVKTLKGHLSGVISLLYLSGQILASGSADYTIKIWDLQSGEALKTISGHTGDILCLCQPFKILLPKKYPDFADQRCLISGSSDKTIRVWKLNKKNNQAIQVRNLVGHKDYVQTLVMLPDDSTLVSGSLDKSILLWNIHTGQNLAKLDGHTSFITRINLYSERVILSSSTDGTLRFWDVNIKSCVHTLEGHQGAVNNFCILPDQSIWSVGFDKNIHVWD